MDRITFLDNYYQGKNNVWRYILTTLLTWGLGFILTMVFLIFILAFIFIINSGNGINYADSPYSYPLFTLIELGISYAISFLLFYICMHFIHHKKVTSLINTSSKVNWMKIVKGAALWLILSGFILLIDFIIDPTSFKLSFSPNTFFILLILCLIIFPIQASLEEIFFRGYLMQGIGSLTKMPLVPLITTSIIFALLHFFNGTDLTTGIVIVIQMFIFGITLGIITLGENRLETAMGVHIAQNIFVTAIIGDSESVIPNLNPLITSESGLGIGIPFFVPLLILLVVIFWNKRSKVSRIFKIQGHPKYQKSQSNVLRCFNCNALNLNEAVYCRECGIKIKRPGSIKNYSKDCPRCYTLNPEEAVYCRHCGMKIINSKALSHSIKIQCINCHTVNPDEAIYCKYCGTRI